MNPIIAFNVISKQFTKHRNSLMKLEYDINSGAATTVYVQLHDFPTAADLAAGNTAPAAGAVPLKSWPVTVATQATDNIKLFEDGEMTFVNGIFACVSTTQATLTIGTGNNKFDSVAAETWDADLTGTSEVQGTANLKVVWTEAAGLTHDYRLLRAAMTNLTAAVAYLQLFAIGAPGAGNIPLLEWPLAATGDSAGNDSIGVYFGTNGLFVRSQDGLTIKQGCTLVISSTAGFYTPTAANQANFYAESK